MPGRRSARRVYLRAENVWDRLNRLNLSQNDLARLLEVSSGYVSRMLNGRRCPSPSMRRRLMRILDSTEFEEFFVVVNADEA